MFFLSKHENNAIIGDNLNYSRCRRHLASMFEISKNLNLQQFKIIQGHRSWCQSKAHMWLHISH